MAVAMVPSGCVLMPAQLMGRVAMVVSVAVPVVTPFVVVVLPAAPVRVLVLQVAAVGRRGGGGGIAGVLRSEERAEVVAGGVQELGVLQDVHGRGNGRGHGR